MLTRTLCGLLFLTGGCTIHVVESPATPLASRPAVLVAEAAEARPARVHHEHRPAPAPESTTPPAATPPERAQPSSRSDLTPHRPRTRVTEPAKSRPLYTPFRSVGSDKVSSPLSAQPTATSERHKVELPHK